MVHRGIEYNFGDLVTFRLTHFPTNLRWTGEVVLDDGTVFIKVDDEKSVLFNDSVVDIQKIVI